MGPLQAPGKLPSVPDLKQTVLEALQDALTLRFSFVMQDIDRRVTVSSSNLAFVFNAIWGDAITVRPLAEYHHATVANGAYERASDTMFVAASGTSGGNDPIQRDRDRGFLVHECVHALFDLFQAEHLSRASDEVGAYLVQTLYYMSKPQKVFGFDPRPSAGAITNPFNNLAFCDIFTEAELLTKRIQATPNLTLTRNDYQTMRGKVITYYDRFVERGYKDHAGVPIKGLGVRGFAVPP